MAQAMAVSSRASPWRTPVAVSLGLHALVIALMTLNLSFCRSEVVLPPPAAHVKAVLVERSVAAPKAAAVPVPEPQPEPVPPPPVKKPEPKKPEPKRPEPKRPEPKKPEPKKPEPKKPEAKKPEPKKPAAKPVEKPVEKPQPKEKPKPVTPDFSALLEREESALAASDADRRAAAQQAQREASAKAAADAKTVSEYTALIRAEVERRWSRPPSARTGMQAELRIILIPGGEVLDVQLIKSSGDPAFDRSAENAVRLAGRLPVPADAALFNTYFRQFKFLFRPEGLRQ